MLVRKHWEQLRQIIKENDLKSAGDVYALLKDSFKELLQELLEAELDVSLGYDKNEKHGIETDNKRNGHTPKTVKSEFGEFQLDIPRDRNGEFEPEILVQRFKNSMESMYQLRKYLRLQNVFFQKSRNGSPDHWSLFIHLCSWMQSIIKSGEMAGF